MDDPECAMLLCNNYMQCGNSKHNHASGDSDFCIECRPPEAIPADHASLLGGATTYRCNLCPYEAGRWSMIVRHHAALT